MRSFTDPPAFKNSHFARISQPEFRPIFWMRTIGVFPMASRMESRILATGESSSGEGFPAVVTGPAF